MYRFCVHNRPIITQISEDGDVRLFRIVADMLERHHLRGLVAHSGFYSCEYCLAEGRGISGGIDFYFPANYGVEERTHEQWHEIATKQKNEEVVKAYGVTSYSPLLDVPGGFDIVHGLPIDQFHNIFEGLVKLAMTRLLRPNAISKKIKARFNKQYMLMRTFKDSPRRTRSLNNLPDFKGMSNV